MDGIVFWLLELEIIIFFVKHVTQLHCINNNKHFDSLIQLCVLIFNVEKCNIYMNIFGNPWPFLVVCIVYL